MDLRFPRAEQDFREEVRLFVRSHLPADIADKVRNRQRLGKDDFVRWHRILQAMAGARPTGRSSTAARAGTPCNG